MSIEDGFKKILEGMRLADIGRDTVLLGLEEAWKSREDLNTVIKEIKEDVEGIKEDISTIISKVDDLTIEVNDLKSKYVK